METSFVAGYQTKKEGKIMQFKRKEDEESIKCQKNGDEKAQTIEAKQERGKDKKNIL